MLPPPHTHTPNTKEVPPCTHTLWEVDLPLYYEFNKQSKLFIYSSITTITTKGRATQLLRASSLVMQTGDDKTNRWSLTEVYCWFVQSLVAWLVQMCSTPLDCSCKPNWLSLCIMDIFSMAEADGFMLGWFQWKLLRSGSVATPCSTDVCKNRLVFMSLIGMRYEEKKLSDFYLSPSHVFCSALSIKIMAIEYYKVLCFSKYSFKNPILKPILTKCLTSWTTQ